MEDYDKKLNDIMQDKRLTDDMKVVAIKNTTKNLIINILNDYGNKQGELLDKYLMKVW